MPKFEAGHSKVPGSGRPPGRLGKRARVAMQVMQDENIEPLAILARTWKNRRMPFELRHAALVAMLPYCYPRLSAVTSTSQTDVRMVSIDLIRDNPMLASKAEEIALALAAQPKLLEAPATEYTEA